MKIFEKIKDQIKNFQNIKDKKKPSKYKGKKKRKGFAFFFFNILCVLWNTPLFHLLNTALSAPHS